MQGLIEPFWLLAFCCVVYFTTISTSSIAGSDLLLRSKTCPIAAGRRFFYSVVVFYFHGSTMGCFRRYIRFVGPKLYLVPALWDAFDVTLICFVGSKLSSVFCFGPRSKISFRCGWWCWWAVCHCLWWVLFDGFQHSSILLHDQQMFHSSDCITLVWCPSVVFERLILWGGFLSPTHARSVRDWCKRGCKSWSLEWPLLSRWLCVSVDVAS